MLLKVVVCYFFFIPVWGAWILVWKCCGGKSHKNWSVWGIFWKVWHAKLHCIKFYCTRTNLQSVKGGFSFYICNFLYFIKVIWRTKYDLESLFFSIFWTLVNNNSSESGNIVADKIWWHLAIFKGDAQTDNSNINRMSFEYSSNAITHYKS